MDLGALPENVLRIVGFELELADRVRLARVNRHLFSVFIPLIYGKVVYCGCGRAPMGIDERGGYLTEIGDHNVQSFLATLCHTSVLGLRYSEVVVNLFLEDLQASWLAEWRNQLGQNAFPKLLKYIFPTCIEVRPLTFEEAPNLGTLVIDRNFCLLVDSLQGMVNVFNHLNIRSLLFKGELGHNEDMMMFNLVTSFPHMINQLCELHFSVDDNENYNHVYRRLVGFCAILRRINLPLPNLNSLTLPLTNQSSDAIVNLLGRHIIFENLTSLTLLIQDDSDVLNLIKPIDKLGTIVKTHGINIERLNIKYHLTREDEDKNHLRAMMLLKFCESFHKLKSLRMELNIKSMNLSNILMIFGAPISNNLRTLQEISINISDPSQNVISKILPTLNDATMIFPYLNFITDCPCSICQDIFVKLSEIERLKMEEQQNNAFFGFGRLRRSVIEPNRDLLNETIKIGTLLIVGQELDQLHSKNSVQFRSDCLVNQFRGNGWLRMGDYDSGYLFDHLVRTQLNQLYQCTNLQKFELCGLVYSRGSGGFQLRYGGNFSGLKDEDIVNLVDLGHMFSQAR